MSTGTVESSMFEWTVPEIKKSFNRHFSCDLFSPECHLPDSSWKLQALCRNFMIINLMRTDSGPSKVFTCKVKSNIKGGLTTLTVFIKNATYLVLKIYPNEVQYVSNLVITCYINSNTPYQEATQSISRKFTTCAVQTEDVNSVIGRENPIDEDWLSIDIKAESISRKFTTCAVQTEDANSVIGRENPKDEDWSSLDVKDDTLLRERMKELFTNGIKHDVTICVQDKEFRAHQSILSSRSPVFAMMLTHDSKENNTGKIKIEDCDPESFEEFLLYVYSGRTENLTPSNALQLYYPADKYDFPVLKERCVKILKTSLSVESICDVVLLAAKHQEKELLEVATEFFARNMKEILVTVKWQKFMSQNLVEANELFIKSVDIIKDSAK